MAEIESLLIRIEADAALMRREMQRAGQSVERFSKKAGQGMTRFQRSMRTAQRMASRFAVGVGAAMATAFGARAVRDVVAYGAALGHTATRLGFTAEQMQELRFAASDFGIEARQVDMGLQRFTRRLSQAAQEGRGELLPVLQQMGIEFRNNDGSTRDAMEVMLEFADALSEMQNQGDRVLAGFKAFDSEGVVLINVLQQGREAVQAYAQQARDLGIVLSNDLVARAQQVDRQMDILGQRMRGEFSEAVLENADALETLVEMLGSAVSAFVDFIGVLNRTGVALGEFFREADEGLDTLARRTPERALTFADEFIEQLDAGTLGAIEARERLEREMGFLGQQLADELELPTRRRTPTAAGGVAGISMAEIDMGQALDPASEAAERLRSEIRALVPSWQRLSDAVDEGQMTQEEAAAQAEAMAAEQRAAAEAARERAAEEERLQEILNAPARRALETQQAMADALRRQIAAVNEEREAREDLEDVLQAEALVRQVIAQAGGDRQAAGPVDALQAEALAVQRLTRTYEQLVEAQQAAQADAEALAEAALTQQDVFERDLERLRELRDSGALEAAAVEVGLDVDTITLRTVRGLLEDLQESGEGAGISAEYLREQLAGLGIPDAVMEKLRQMPEEIKEAAEAANELAEEFGDSVAKRIEDAILNARSLKELLGDIARDIARILIRQNITNPIANFISRGIGAVLGGGQAEAPSFPGASALLGQSAASVGKGFASMSGAPVNVSLSTTIHAAGADRAALEEVKAQVAELERNAPEAMITALRETDRRATGVDT
jgi:hypothetical protein